MSFSETVSHCRSALETGLDDALRVQYLVQLGSSLRNLGRSGKTIGALEQARRIAHGPA